jgi:3-deoxy-D-manno-octulosonic acid (KDO) 8-phosphate synthase
MIESRSITIGDIQTGARHPFALITGPCQLDSPDHARMMAGRIAEACARTGTPFIVKASDDKANRSSLPTQRGRGVVDGLTILRKICGEFGCAVLTDVHDAHGAHGAHGAPSDGPNMIPVGKVQALIAQSRAGRSDEIPGQYRAVGAVYKARP